jgi:hypothetical protein
MVKFRVICKYCDFSWEVKSVFWETCAKCGSTDFVKKKIDTSNIFGYNDGDENE